VTRDIDIALVGDKKLLRKFRRLGRKESRKGIRRGLRAGAKIITKEAKRLAPRRTGALRKSIKTKAGKRSRASLSVVTIVGEGFFKGEEFYASFIEFGTDHIEGQHFMERAAKAKQEQAGRIATQTIKRKIEQAARS
jgi:HK97 gp10 family phage protein